MDEYLDFLAESAGELPVSDAGIDSGPDYHVKLRRRSFPVGSSISDNRTILRQLNGYDFFTNDFTRDKRGTTIRPMCVCVWISISVYDSWGKAEAIRWRSGSFVSIFSPFCRSSP